MRCLEWTWLIEKTSWQRRYNYVTPVDTKHTCPHKTVICSDAECINSPFSWNVRLHVSIARRDALPMACAGCTKTNIHHIMCAECYPYMKNLSYNPCMHAHPCHLGLLSGFSLGFRVGLTILSLAAWLHISQAKPAYTCHMHIDTPSHTKVDFHDSLHYSGLLTCIAPYNAIGTPLKVCTACMKPIGRCVFQPRTAPVCNSAPQMSKAPSICSASLYSCFS